MLIMTKYPNILFAISCFSSNYKCIHLYSFYIISGKFKILKEKEDSDIENIKNKKINIFCFVFNLIENHKWFVIFAADQLSHINTYINR